MRFFTTKTDKRTGKKKQLLRLQGEMATAANGRYDVSSGHKIPVILLTVVAKTPREDGRTGQLIDAFEVELDLEQANHLASELMAALDSVMPRRARGAQRVPWE